MVKGLRPNVLEQCLGRLVLGICKVGAPFGVNLAMKVMDKTSPKKLQIEVIDRCMAHRMREGEFESTAVSKSMFNLQIFYILVPANRQIFDNSNCFIN